MLPSHQLSQAAAINEGENEPVLCPFVLVLRRKERMKAKKKGKGLLREKKENKEKKNLVEFMRERKRLQGRELLQLNKGERK